MTNQIRKILVANRGEIARRVMRTCRRMGIDTVAVFSDADEDAPHVRDADEAVRIGPAPALESYLDRERILAAAALTGADAIHPGYGFLAENADFAQACRERGLTFIGPSPDVIRKLGSKRAAKALVAAAGVPVVPGSDTKDDPDRDADSLAAAQTPQALAESARAIGFPVLIKASAGGGGRGMRIIGHADDQGSKLEAAIESAKREAKNAFGDDTLLLERYIERPRHIEFQILGDSHGTVIHLFERECSIQRRYQKIIEEAPALSDDLRARMGAAAVAVGRAVGYENAGTVEFILAPDGEFYFLEVNTRLQVEHPVTECITGLDLVREQIRVARGEAIAPALPSPRGAAMELRLYAEDPAREFLPTSGAITDWHLPEYDDIRVDAGVENNQTVSVHYDPMLAKIICHAPTRAEVIDRLHRYLREISVQGLITNRDLLIRILEHPEFRNGNIDTHFLNRHESDLFAAPDVARRQAHITAAAIAATLFSHEARRAERHLLPAMTSGFRNNRGADQSVTYHLAGTSNASDSDSAITINYRNLGADRFRVTAVLQSAPTAVPADTDAAVVGQEEPAHADEMIKRIDYAPPYLTYETSAGLRRRYRITAEPTPSPRHIWVHSLGVNITLLEAPRFPERASEDIAGGLAAPMTGTVARILVSPGQAVAAGESLVVIEAMKMEHAITAPEAGVITHITAAEGEQVEGGQTVVVVEPAS